MCTCLHLGEGGAAGHALVPEGVRDEEPSEPGLEPHGDLLHTLGRLPAQRVKAFCSLERDANREVLGLASVAPFCRTSRSGFCLYGRCCRRDLLLNAVELALDVVELAHFQEVIAERSDQYS